MTHFWKKICVYEKPSPNLRVRLFIRKVPWGSTLLSLKNVSKKQVKWIKTINIEDEWDW